MESITGFPCLKSRPVACYVMWPNISIEYPPWEKFVSIISLWLYCSLMNVVFFLSSPQSAQQLYLYAVTCAVMTVLLLSLTADAQVVKRSAGSVRECQSECTNNVFKCDLRCKYLKFLSGASLKKCHRQCGDSFLDCFLTCAYVRVSVNGRYGNFFKKWSTYF